MSYTKSLRKRVPQDTFSEERRLVIRKSESSSCSLTSYGSTALRAKSKAWMFREVRVLLW